MQPCTLYLGVSRGDELRQLFTSERYRNELTIIKKRYLVLVRCKYTFSRFTCPGKTVLFSSSFRAVLSLFFFLLTRRKKGFQPVKSLHFCVGQQKKKSCLKRISKKIPILEHLNRLITYFKTFSRFTCSKIAVLFTGSFQATLFSFADLRRNKGF